MNLHFYSSTDWSCPNNVADMPAGLCPDLPTSSTFETSSCPNKRFPLEQRAIDVPTEVE